METPPVQQNTLHVNKLVVYHSCAIM